MTESVCCWKARHVTNCCKRPIIGLYFRRIYDVITTNISKFCILETFCDSWIKSNFRTPSNPIEHHHYCNHLNSSPNILKTLKQSSLFNNLYLLVIPGLNWTFGVEFTLISPFCKQENPLTLKLNKNSTGNRKLPGKINSASL